MSLLRVASLLVGSTAAFAAIGCQMTKPEPINLNVTVQGCCCCDHECSHKKPAVPVVVTPEAPKPEPPKPEPPKPEPPKPEPPKPKPPEGGIDVEPVDPSKPEGAKPEGTKPPEVPDEKRSLFGVEVKGKSVLCLDISRSMEGARMTKMKEEAKKVLNNLSGDDAFAIIIFGGNPPVEAYEKVVQATDDNKKKAVDYVDKLKATGDTPAYGALQRACNNYGDKLDQIVFLTDGAPTDGGPDGKSADVILLKFPDWYKKLKENGCKLRCIVIGDEKDAEKFVDTLARDNGGTVVKVKK